MRRQLLSCSNSLETLPYRVQGAACVSTGLRQCEVECAVVNRRIQFSSCLAKMPLSAGSQVTITFALRRDGSAFGKPRISYSRLEGDTEQRQRFLADAEAAIDSCLPLKVTPALGGAIAGRLFSVTIGSPKAERAI